MAIALAVAATPTTARGGNIIKLPFRGKRPLQLDVHVGFSYLGKGLATGARFGIPLFHNGFIKSINNAVYINFGVDIYIINTHHGKSGDEYAGGIGIPVTLHWEFYFTPRWSAFGEAGPNIFIHPGTIKGGGWDWSPGHWFSVAAGGRFFIKDSVTLTLRLGSPYSSLGVSFLF